MTSEVEVTHHESVEAALEYINSPTMLARVHAYYDEVQRQCEAGLSPDDLATFRLWWGGGKVDWAAIGTNPAYCAIMQAISMGCG